MEMSLPELDLLGSYAAAGQIVQLWDFLDQGCMVLPNGPAALSHPTNEDLFAGPRFGDPLGGGGTGRGRVIFCGPSVGRAQRLFGFAEGFVFVGFLEDEEGLFFDALVGDEALAVEVVLNAGVDAAR